MGLKIMFTDLGQQDFGGYGSRADIEGGAGAGDRKFKLDPVTKETLDDSQRTLIIPVNPEDLEITNGIDIESHETSYFAEVITLTGLKLRKFNITSFFPFDTEYDFDDEVVIHPQKYYIEWIQRAMQGKKILLMSVVGDIDYLLPFTCVFTDFSYHIGAYKDIAYTLSVSEYIDYRSYAEARKFTMDGDVLITESTKKRPNLEGVITIGSIVKVINGFAHINSLGTKYATVQGLSSLYRYAPSRFISVNTLFDAHQLAKEINRPKDMEWVVASILPRTLYDTSGPREFYQSLCSNQIGIPNLLNIHIVSLSSRDDGWVTMSQLALVR